MRILIVDDSAVVRQGLRAFLASHPELKVVGEASSGERALTLAKQLQPELVLLDISMPGMDGLEVSRRLRRLRLGLRVIMLSIIDDVEHVMDSFTAGARGYVIKDDSDEIFAAIERVRAGKLYCSLAVRGGLAAELAGPARAGGPFAAREFTEIESGILARLIAANPPDL